jgi:hypothetical protein
MPATGAHVSDIIDKILRQERGWKGLAEIK